LNLAPFLVALAEGLVGTSEGDPAGFIQQMVGLPW
jgi:hypothetical protein